MLKRFYNGSKIVAGMILIILGVIAFFVPLIPGFLLVIAGLLLLGYKEKHIHKFWRKFKKKVNEWIK